MIKYVIDTSVIMNERVSKLIEEGEIEKNSEIIIPQIVVAEIENHANMGRLTGYLGVNELKNIRKLCDERNVELYIIGDRPTLEQIKLASGGELDSIIRDYAKEPNSMLITSDRIQAEIAKAQNIKVKFIIEEKTHPKVDINDYFTKDTMSIHLKEGLPPKGKVGTPGNWELINLDDRPIDLRTLEELVRAITEKAKSEKDCFLEIEYKGAIVAQLNDLRITITEPPFSDALEITAIKPIKALTLEDYEIPQTLIERFKLLAEGILICGPPGSGKSTFAGALATLYEKEKKIVKTMENPRDLQVPRSVTQYAPLENDLEKTADVILLVRPDFTIFDEIRKTKDFSIFADMRSAGIGMIGVIHATAPVDAIQRMLINRKIELGMVPQIIDTIIFINKGDVEDVYYLKMRVRVPKGMIEKDLARPIIEVYDFYTNDIMYEIYTYGDNIVVMPLAEKFQSPENKIVRDKIRNAVRQYAPNSRVEAEIVSNDRVKVYVDKSAKPNVIGKNGKTVRKLENRFGVHIDVRKFPEGNPILNKSPKKVYFNFRVDKKYIHFQVDNYPNHFFQVVYNGDNILTAKSDSTGDIKIRKNSKNGRKIMNLFKHQEQFELYLL
ncbi:MAG: PIN domain-containing protein [Candidatus Lokiarchaeota archaeon]|nr:PIN domain-containing protein [Candidatus Lokiarchaeota archaeon]